MEYPKTQAVRPVNSRVNETVGHIPNGSFNYGLYFQKWLYTIDYDSAVNDNWKRGKPWSCSMRDETDLKKGKRGNENICHPNILLDNLDVSIALFNGIKVIDRDAPVSLKDGYAIKPKAFPLNATWDRDYMGKRLNEYHKSLENEKCKEAYIKIGYHYFQREIPLRTPMVIGLGNEHPTEKGFRFDWNLGIPAIPASSIKGVVRLAYLVNELRAFEVEEDAKSFWDKMCNNRLPDNAQQIFGCGEIDKQTAKKGKVIFFDAFPSAVPRLKSEIMNCHYPDYLNNEAKRGPTEDQQPNPQKFWAVDTSADEKGTPLTFIFRVLLHKSIAENENLLSRFEKAFASALEDHGFGAKTAIGHGRFNSNRSKAKQIGLKTGQSPAAAAPVQKVDPAKVREEKMSSFKKQLAGCKNLPGEINRFLENVKAQEDQQLQQEMCRAIVEKGEELDKKKRFSKALNQGSKWAIDLKNLCDSCGLNLQDIIKIG